MNSKSIICAAALLALASPAKASDISYKDAPDYGSPAMWTGFYVGVHGGWAQGNWNGELQYQGETDAAFKDPKRSLDGDGWIGGFQVGANRQIDQIVLGVEVDASFGDFSGTGVYGTDNVAGHPDGGWTKTFDMQMDWFGTARVRAGYAVGRYLPYITGGLAFAQTSADLEISYPYGQRAS